METIDVALLILRLAVGLTFAAHGAQKAFGWWNGPGITGWSSMVAQMGYRPARAFALLAAALELGGGLLLAVGLLTPLAAAAIVAQTVVIIGQVHWRNGFFNTTGGFEFPLLIGLGAVAVAIAGPGTIAVDRLIGVSLDVAPTVALVSAALIAGLVGLIVPRLTAPDPMAHQH